MNCPRCGKPVDEHEAGRETDACFAEVVMGWHGIDLGRAYNVGLGIAPSYWDGLRKGQSVGDERHALPRYSTDRNAAWEGFDLMDDWDLTKQPGPVPYIYCQVALNGRVSCGSGPTVALAIDRACLEAIITKPATPPAPSPEKKGQEE